MCVTLIISLSTPYCTPHTLHSYLETSEPQPQPPPKHASVELRGDRAVVMEAAKQDDNQLHSGSYHPGWFATDELRCDRVFVAEVVRQSGVRVRG